MADNTILHPEGSYKIAAIGPVESWSFSKDGGQVEMKKYALQFDGMSDWVNLNQAATTEPPKVGDTLEGKIEDAGKFGTKFVKKRKGGFGGFGGGSSPGAAWNGAYTIAASVVAGYFAAVDQSPANMKEYLSKVDQIAATIKTSIDKASGNNVEASKPKAQESLPVVDVENNPVVEDVKEDDLGEW